MFICKTPSRFSLGLTLTLPCIQTAVEYIIKIFVFTCDFSSTLLSLVVTSMCYFIYFLQVRAQIFG